MLVMVIDKGTFKQCMVLNTSGKFFPVKASFEHFVIW